MYLRFYARGKQTRYLACLILALSMLIPQSILAQGNPPTAQNLGMQLSSRAALMEAAGQVDQALSLYRQSWKTHPRPSTIDSILSLSQQHAPRGNTLSFLSDVRSEVSNQKTQASIDTYLGTVLPAFAATHAKLKIYVYPPQTRVVITTPRQTHRVESGTSIWSEPGAVTIQAVARDHEQLGRSIHVQAGGNESILLALNPRGPSGVVSIQSMPPSAQIQLDGVPLGLSPIKNLRVRAGSHVVTAHLGDHPISRQMIRVRDNASANAELTLAELPKLKPHDFKRAVQAAANHDVRPRRQSNLKSHPDDRKYASGMAGIVANDTDLSVSSDSGTSWLVPAGWITLASGIAAAGVGAYYTYAGITDVDAANQLNRLDYKTASGELDEAAFDAAFALYEDRSKLLFQRSFILYGGGAALVTTGILMVLLAPDGADEPSFSFAPLPGGATLQTMTRF